MSGVRKLAPGAIQLGTSSRAVGAAPGVARPPGATPSPCAQDIYKQAYLDGFAAGQEDGRKEAQQQNSRTLGKLQDALAEAAAARRDWQEGMALAAARFEQACAQQQEQIAQLAAEVAELAVRKIVGRLHADRRAVSAVCRETIDALGLKTVEVRISQSDLAGFPELAPAIELVGDPSLKAGECLLRSPLGDIDAGIATQLAQLRESLVAALAQEHS